MSEVLSEIQRILNEKVDREPRKYRSSIFGPEPLHGYHVGFDEHARMVYMAAKIHFDGLDKGSDPTPEAQQGAKNCGYMFIDQVCQFIDKRIGGDWTIKNVFQVNIKVETSQWKLDEQKVYDFVKNGNGQSCACIKIGVTYDDENDQLYSRPHKIFYRYELLENDEIVEILEGLFENLPWDNTDNVDM